MATGGLFKRDKLMKIMIGNADKQVTGQKEGKSSWESIRQRYGGVPASLQELTMGGQYLDKSPDILKFIKKHDPQNTAGSIKEAIDILTKLQEATKSNSLMSSIEPLQNILGGQLYSAMQSGGSQASAAQKVSDAQQEEQGNEDQFDIIAALIAAALAKIAEDDPEAALEAESLLDTNEVRRIRDAFYGNKEYTSTVEIAIFVDTINELMPIFRITYGVGQSTGFVS